MTLPSEQVRTDKGRRRTGPGAQILRSQSNVEEPAKETEKEKPDREEQGQERAGRSGSAGDGARPDPEAWLWKPPQELEYGEQKPGEGKFKSREIGRVEVVNQGTSFEAFCYKGMERNEANAGRHGVEGGLFVFKDGEVAAYLL